MLVNLFHDSPGEHRRLQVAGVVFVLAIAMLIALSIAIYDKRFTRTTTVTVMAERAGLQLSRFGDVRMHGALIGYVEEIQSTQGQAEITLALEPDSARAISSDVGARIVPTTLFGQKFVELVPGDGEVSNGPLRDGSVIPAERVTTNVELQTILADLFPLLRSVRPEDLNATLYAVAHALQGKGAQIGDTLVELDGYLDGLNEKLPTLRTDLQLLADVTETYDMAAPDLVNVLRNATVTARTVNEQSGDLDRALASLTGLAKMTRATVSEHEELLVDGVQSGRPLLALLDTYSPQLPCLLTGLDRQIEDTKNVFQDGIIHQTLELGAPQRSAYGPADAPVYGEIGRGPWCLGLPDDYEKPAPFLPLADGTDKDEPDGGIP
ncbi:MCE family protein [Aeromicrobium sp. CTD01-1L150]|uniref:MCE family protein n=1 Tax=Aeromicrobium sp. CTD01-1L150 TaxID=3341830 RepID=UPI0035C1CA36